MTLLKPDINPVGLPCANWQWKMSFGSSRYLGALEELLFVVGRGLLLFEDGLLEVFEGKEPAEEFNDSDGDSGGCGGADDDGGIIPFEVSFLLDFRFDEKIGMINLNSNDVRLSMTKQM